MSRITFDSDDSTNTSINLGFSRLNTLCVTSTCVLSDQVLPYITSLSSVALYFAYLIRHMKQARSLQNKRLCLLFHDFSMQMLLLQHYTVNVSRNVHNWYPATAFWKYLYFALGEVICCAGISPKLFVSRRFIETSRRILLVCSGTIYPFYLSLRARTDAATFVSARTRRNSTCLSMHGIPFRWF